MTARYRPVEEAEFAAFRDTFMAANSDLTEKSKFDNKIMPNAVDAAMDEFETRLVLQAASANEDKLQVCRAAAAARPRRGARECGHDDRRPARAAAGAGDDRAALPGGHQRVDVDR